MRYLIAFCFAACFLLSIDPPEELRLSDNEESAFSEQLAATIPACYKNGTFSLGKDLNTVRSATGAKTTFTENGGYSYLSWKEYNPATLCDTFVHCTFRSGIMVGLAAISRFENTFFDKISALEALEPQFSCINEIRPLLEFGQNLSYVEENLSRIQEFRLIKKSNLYSGMFYEIRYPDTPSYTNTFESHS